MKTLTFSLLFPVSSALAGIAAVGPDYVRPTVTVPPAYENAAPGDAVAWKLAAPSEAVARGAWWQVFNDPVLHDLESRSLAANQDLRAAASRVDQARAAAGLARSGYWPQVAVSATATREQASETTANVLPHGLANTYRTPLTAAWELDLFGRVRRASESAREEAESSAANLESVRLSLAAEVATTYFSIRAVEREASLLARTVELRRRARELVDARHRSGAATEIDVARAETELAAAEADAAQLANRRASLVNVLAVLVGEPAPGFSVAPTDVVPTPLAIPAGLPAALLERRPDVAAAEHALAAANARIGVAKAAFFPAISLSGSAGFASAELDRLFQTDSRLWSIGPSLYLPIFQGGRNRANLARSRAAYEESVATYRQRVLVAFREVQDALTGTRLLAEQAEAQRRALTSARRAAELARIRYDSGYVSYFEVIEADRTALTVERTSAQLDGQRLSATVSLIKALGGGWQVAPGQVLAFNQGSP